VSGGRDVELIELSDQECRRLLSEHRVGRLGLAVGGAPVILPVNYAFDGERVVFRTDQGLKLRHAPRRRVAFEIDGIDEEAGTGWSVLVQGSAFEIIRSVDSHAEELLRLPVNPLAAGEKAHWIEIVPHMISGRRICASARKFGTNDPGDGEPLAGQ
jgi:nitroimidazol reductase NimA-like FMN-containing flavoprotein (pyridoxamine 5'-phosphate oxidase superfamily)